MKNSSYSFNLASRSGPKISLHINNNDVRIGSELSVFKKNHVDAPLKHPLIISANDVVMFLFLFFDVVIFGKWMIKMTCGDRGG